MCVNEGLFQHKGDKVKFSSRFGQGSIIGVHLDMWHGTLTFYKNRHLIGMFFDVYMYFNVKGNGVLVFISVSH